MKRVSTAYLLTCAAVGVATGLLIVPATAVTTIAFPVAPPVSALMYAAWVIGFVVAMRLIERPGAALLTGLISGLVAAPLSVTGPAIIVTNLMTALVIELPFLLTLYRRWSRWLYYAGATVYAIGYSVVVVFAYDMLAFPVWVPVLHVAITVASAPLGTWLGIVIADRLARTGIARVARRRAPDAVDAPPAKGPAAGDAGAAGPPTP